MRTAASSPMTVTRIHAMLTARTATELIRILTKALSRPELQLLKIEKRATPTEAKQMQ